MQRLQGLLGWRYSQHCIFRSLMIWYHPKYYKELEKIRKELEAKLKRQAASNKQEGASNEEEEQAGQAEARDPKDP